MRGEREPSTRSGRTTGHEFSLLRSIPGIGEVLALTLLYEIDDLQRFERVQDFLSYARLVKGRHESAG